MSTLNECLFRAAQISQRGKLYESVIPGNNYNYNLKTNTDYNDNLTRSPQGPGAVYNYNRLTPAKVVKTDPAFVRAVKEWGMMPGALVNQIKRYSGPDGNTARGASIVKKWLTFVAGISDDYFDLDRPVGPQRGAYCMACLQTPYEEVI